MKKQLSKIFYAFIVTAMMISTNANAQIVYTDVNPDSTMISIGSHPLIRNYNLDLNNDGQNDFILTATHSSFGALAPSSTVKVSPVNGNAVMDTVVNFVNVSIPLQFNAVIDGNLLLNQSWQTSGVNILKKEVYANPSQGQWDSLSDYYLGLRLLQSGQTYYGWARLHVDVTTGYGSVIIRDYAYNSIPNQPILAGQTIATGIIESSFASSINLFPNPATNHLTIALPNANEKVEITITDISGKTIYSTTASDADSYREQKIEVNTEDFAEGIYVTQIQKGEFIETKIFIVKK